MMRGHSGSRLVILAWDGPEGDDPRPAHHSDLHVELVLPPAVPQKGLADDQALLLPHLIQGIGGPLALIALPSFRQARRSLLKRDHRDHAEEMRERLLSFHLP